MKVELSPRRRKAQFMHETKGLVIPFFGVDTEEGLDERHSKYTSLTDRQYRAFMNLYRGEGSESQPITLGFTVLGNLLRNASVAYTEFLNHSGENPNLAELRDSLIGDFSSLVSPIAELDGDRATRYETGLGLYRGDDPLGSTTSHEFRRREDGLHLTPKLDHLDIIDREIAIYDRTHGINDDPTKGCPALAFVLPVLWETDVKGCVSDPDYFAADIESALESVKVEA